MKPANFFRTRDQVHMCKYAFRDCLVHRKAQYFSLSFVGLIHRNVLYMCARVRRAHAWCPWGADLSLGSGWLWSERRTLIFKHMLLRERDCKWFMIYTVDSRLKKFSHRKDSLNPPCLCGLLSSCSYMAQLSSCTQSLRVIISFFSNHLSAILSFPRCVKPLCCLQL